MYALLFYFANLEFWIKVPKKYSKVFRSSNYFLDQVQINSANSP